METAKGKVPAGDIDIAYTAVGSGKPLLVVHGGPGIGPRYLRGLEAWADEFQIICYDQRGCGETELGDPSRVSFKGHLDDVDAVRAGLGIEKANLVGHSAGAHIAMLYAAHRSGTTGSLVLLNSGPPLVPELQDRLWANMATRRTAEDEAEKQEIEGSAEFQARDPKTLERYFINMYLPFFRDRKNTEKMDLGFTGVTAANVLKAWERTFSDIEDLDPLGSLGQISCPTLVVHGEQDPTPQEWPALLVDRIGGSGLAILEGCNHFAQLEDPQTLATAVKPFLRTNAI